VEPTVTSSKYGSISIVMVSDNNDRPSASLDISFDTNETTISPLWGSIKLRRPSKNKTDDVTIAAPVARDNNHMGRGKFSGDTTQRK
jgi:hypothetical protein